MVNDNAEPQASQEAKIELKIALTDHLMEVSTEIEYAESIIKLLAEYFGSEGDNYKENALMILPLRHLQNTRLYLNKVDQEYC